MDGCFIISIGIIIALALLLCLYTSKKATSGAKRFIIDPAWYEITLSEPPTEGMRISLYDKYNTVFPSILEYESVKASIQQSLIGADRPLESIIVGVTPKKDVWKGEIEVIRYDYVSKEELERKIYKSNGYVGTHVTQYICPNDNTAVNFTAAVEACNVPTYFAFDPARQIKPVIEMDRSLTRSNVNDRAYKANLYKNFDYSDIRPINLFTRRQYEKLNDRNRSSYSRVALSPRAGLQLNEAEWYDPNPFQRSSFEGPYYSITLLNNVGIENSGTDGLVRVALYNQLTNDLLAGPVVFNEYGRLSVGQEGKETIKVRGMGKEAVPLEYVIVGITNYDKSAWAGEVVVQTGEDILNYRSSDTEIGALKGEFVNEYRCFDGSIYDNLEDAVTRCGLHREPMSEDITRQFYLDTSPYTLF